MPVVFLNIWGCRNPAILDLQYEIFRRASRAPPWWPSHPPPTSSVPPVPPGSNGASQSRILRSVAAPVAGAVGGQGPVSAKPGNMTPAQWFETQHVQPRPQGCNTAIHKINKFSKHCKDFNTFLHESIYCMVTTCRTPNLACKNGHKNCHQSQSLYPWLHVSSSQEGVQTAGTRRSNWRHSSL